MRPLLSKSQAMGLAVFVIGAIIVLANTVYAVDQRDQVVVVRFGDPVRVVNPPSKNEAGLHLKYPFTENVVTFDRRSIALEPASEEIIASNQERLVVDAFVRYRISDPLQFYRAVRNEGNANDRLERLTNSALRAALAQAPTQAIIADRRHELMQQIKKDVAARAKASRIGLEVIDLRIKRADLPEQNQESTYNRMRSDRVRKAAEERALGEQRALEIRGEATREAQTIKGQGDAERARLFASSFGKDPAFASFYRSMQAYEAAMANGQTTLVLSPDSEFFRYFSRGPGR